MGPLILPVHFPLLTKMGIYSLIQLRTQTVETLQTPQIQLHLAELADIHVDSVFAPGKIFEAACPGI